MSDWRIRGQEAYLSNVTFYKVTFPELWETAYTDKNAFFEKIEQYVKRHVAEANLGHEFLEGDRIQHFWHEHCEFCWEKALTNKPCEFYCTKDMGYWVCAECFHDFCERFDWQVKPANELFD